MFNKIPWRWKTIQNQKIHYQIWLKKPCFLARISHPAKVEANKKASRFWTRFWLGCLNRKTFLFKTREPSFSQWAPIFSCLGQVQFSPNGYKIITASSVSWSISGFRWWGWDMRTSFPSTHFFRENRWELTTFMIFWGVMSRHSFWMFWGWNLNFPMGFWGLKIHIMTVFNFRWDIHLQHKEFRPSDAGLPNLRDV